MAKIEQTFATKQVKIHGEIRKVEEVDLSFTGKDGKVVESKATLLKIDDDDEERIELYDKQSDAIGTYARGQVGTFTLRMDYKPTYGAGNMEAKMLVVGFEQDGGRQRPRRADEG